MISDRTSVVPRFRPLVLLITTVKEEDVYETLRDSENGVEMKGAVADTSVVVGWSKDYRLLRVPRLRPLVLLEGVARKGLG